MHFLQERYNRRILVLVSPGVEPDRANEAVVMCAIGAAVHRLSGVVGLLRASAGEIPLNLVQKARLPKAPVTVHTEHLGGVHWATALPTSAISAPRSSESSSVGSSLCMSAFSWSML